MLLTNEEYEQAKNRLHDITLANQLTANKRKQLRKRIKDYEYSLKYLPFEPTYYIIKYINKTTEILNLEKYILDSKNATRFIIDTESTIKPYHPNEPTLIQIDFKTNSVINSVVSGSTPPAISRVTKI
ncbi:unnamed protein product [Didymodactylos carnosus]|uniref:Uncharacterized protein n=1 Tax=Didymodactylos carnosus TaxID=1234261 RepID=A0A814SG21_9BILA|nr:unnamed protein product [Didymodactylos carnosus]CAF1146792.1 unnamed protein product [Didymodactylos carnosus]CAF3807893.1 unnamed protein product [Didymodactylos carnosus]CAF3910324.1 unnamed protein product [Didymodactylos carnosus]